ncbi:TetR family transcriptional regulator C-terminal domain-containing protein [Streptomyces prunicolor]|uniref:TetR family transcriptional regulator C-terminal domain-containing protein n=1 Tax=Streptomyces prunicolor TaxID=67348 RepID=UPI000361704F|nr:TetR family transcriptional regulator C-terminal domain-containing protein [Streptomyces prunicolor]
MSAVDLVVVAGVLGEVRHGGGVERGEGGDGCGGEQGPTGAGLRRLRGALVDYQRRLQCRGGCPIGSLGSEVAETNPEARLAVVSGLLRWETPIHDGMRDMHARGELDGDPDDLALTTLAALQGGLLRTRFQREVRPLEVALDSTLDHVEARTCLKTHVPEQGRSSGRHEVGQAEAEPLGCRARSAL